MRHPQYLTRIVLTAKSENARSPEWSVERDVERLVWAGSAAPLRCVPVGPSVGTLSGIELDDWAVEFVTEYRDEFKKIASVVGKEAAEKVYRALGRGVPKDWDKG